MSYVTGLIAGMRYADQNQNYAGGFIRAYETGQAEELAKILAVAAQFKDLNALIAWLEDRKRHVEILAGGVDE